MQLTFVSSAKVQIKNEKNRFLRIFSMFKVFFLYVFNIKAFPFYPPLWLKNKIR